MMLTRVSSLAVTSDRFKVPAIRLPFLLLQVLVQIAIGGALVYLISIAIGAAAGFALPTTALMRWSSLVRWVAKYDYDLIYILLAAVALCVLGVWAAVVLDVRLARADEVRIAGLLKRWGLLLACCLFVFSLSGVWCGLARQGDFQSASIVGLVPFSDAGGYFASAHDYFKDGVFSTFALRRPLAAAARTLLLIAGDFSYANMLLVQVLLLALATWFGARAISRWRGIWAGLTYFALSFIVMRSFLPTTLTEPLGFFWALLGVPFFVNGLRMGSWRLQLVAFAFVTVALMTRMGAMFLIPAFALWMLLRFGKSLRSKIGIIMAIIGVFAGVVAADSAVQSIYGHGQQIPGGNFSYSLCGLSIDGVWSDCVKKYSSELKRLAPGEKARVDFMYKQALENIKSDPGTFLARVAAGAAGFVGTLPDTIIKGYMYVTPPRWFPPRAFYLLAAFGLLYVALLRREQGEFEFWLLILLGIVASSAFVYFDDGRRVMAVAYPFVCTLLASGFLTPRSIVGCREKNDRRLAKIGLAILSGGAVLVVAGPIAAAVTMQRPRFLPSRQPPHVQYVAGGRRMTGILVLADTQPLPKDVPAMHLSAFEEIIRRSGIQIYQGLVDPTVPQVPFAFITSARLEKGVPSDWDYIAPPKVLLDHSVEKWRLTVRPWQRKPGESVYWYLVTKAEAEND